MPGGRGHVLVGIAVLAQHVHRAYKTPLGRRGCLAYYRNWVHATLAVSSSATTALAWLIPHATVELVEGKLAAETHDWDSL